MTLSYALVCKLNILISPTCNSHCFERDSLGRHTSPAASYIFQASLKLNATLWSQFPKCWDSKLELLCPVVPLFYSCSPFHLHRKLWAKNDTVNLIFFGYKSKPDLFLSFTFRYISMLSGPSVGQWNHLSGLNSKYSTGHTRPQKGFVSLDSQSHVL